MNKRVVSPACAGLLWLAMCPSAQAADLPCSLDYTPFERVLTAFVNAAGLVDYPALKSRRADLDQFIAQLERSSPANCPKLFPTRDDQLAYWINAYNAWILRLVVDNYPTTSITKIGTIPFGAFFVKRVTLGGKKMTLRSLENDTLRSGFHDPRVHFAINCASRSCPPLARELYQPATLDQQLDHAARAFINDDRNVTLDETSKLLVLSKIFDWYASDFKPVESNKNGTVIEYLKRYLTPERLKILEGLSGAKITYHEYNWSLNARAAVK